MKHYLIAFAIGGVVGYLAASTLNSHQPWLSAWNAGVGNGA